MEAIRKIIKVEDASIHFDELAKYNNQDVEIIIFPINKEEDIVKKKRKTILDYSGIVESGHSDTSEKTDKLIYGK